MSQISEVNVGPTETTRSSLYSLKAIIKKHFSFSFRRALLSVAKVST